MRASLWTALLGCCAALTSAGTSPAKVRRGSQSRGAAADSSPRRQPWVPVANAFQAPAGATDPRRIRMRHDRLPPLRGWSNTSPTPRLTPWAAFFRASGAANANKARRSRRSAASPLGKAPPSRWGETPSSPVCRRSRRERCGHPRLGGGRWPACRWRRCPTVSNQEHDRGDPRRRSGREPASAAAARTARGQSEGKRNAGGGRARQSQTSFRMPRRKDRAGARF